MLHWLLSVAEWLADPKIAGTIGAISLVVTLIGFAITIVQVRHSKSAAEAAAASAQAVREQLSRFDAIAECSAAIQSLEEIERLHRSGPLHALPERYNSVRKALIQVSRVDPPLAQEKLAQITSAISQLASFKVAIEKLLSENGPITDSVRFNRITTKIITDLVGISADLRGEMRKV